jgi:hypothetical protein
MARLIPDPWLLSLEERELVVAAAAAQGRACICTRSDTHGRAVRVKDRSFADASDRSFAQRYIQAVLSLERRQYIRQCGRRDAYELTNVGWEASRSLTRAAKSPTTEDPVGHVSSTAPNETS